MIHSWLDLATNCLSFGLGLYALTAIVSFALLVRRNEPLVFPPVEECIRVCACLAVLASLELARQLWDAFNSQHFPMWITRLILPATYLILGNAVFRIGGGAKSKAASAA